jgi:regulator of protease activity HflC (stomatin/prohibitin superfamily)
MQALCCLVPLLLVLFILSGFKINQEYERAVVFTLGRYRTTKGPGIFWIIPFIDRYRKIDIRTVTVNVEPQETITRDSVTVKINAVLWFLIEDPAHAIIRVADYRQAVYQAAMTSLRNIVGQCDLDELLRERDKINEILREIVDKVTDTWGVKITMIEMKDVEIPVSMQRAMAQEAEAVRQKRARLIKAQAELEASEKLAIASQQMMENPAALELRRMQMVSEVGAEHNSTTVILMPADFVNMAGALARKLEPQGAPPKPNSNPPERRA